MSKRSRGDPSATQVAPKQKKSDAEPKQAPVKARSVKVRVGRFGLQLFSPTLTFRLRATQQLVHHLE